MTESWPFQWFYPCKGRRENNTKIFINQSLCPYYGKFCGMAKDLNNEGLTDYFWIKIF